MNRQRRKRLTEAFEKVAEAMEILEEVKSEWSMVSWLIIAWKMVRCHMEIQTTESIMAIRRKDAKPMTALGC